MLFFKRYLEKSQQVADHFESSQIPCYIKMRDLPAPPVVDHCRDLILSSCSLRFMPYTDDWIVVEYFADHDSDYLVSMYVVLSIEPTHLLPLLLLLTNLSFLTFVCVLQYTLFSSGSVKWSARYHDRSRLHSIPLYFLIYAALSWAKFVIRCVTLLWFLFFWYSDNMGKSL